MIDRRHYRYMNNQHDLTFLFDIKTSGNIITIITDNTTECDVAMVDIPSGAKKFYDNKIYELSHKKTIDGIREMLHKREEVPV
jgi:hypothetical protein